MSNIGMWYRTLQTMVREHGDVDEAIASMDNAMLEAFRLGLAGDADGLVAEVEDASDAPTGRRGRRIVVK